MSPHSTGTKEQRNSFVCFAHEIPYANEHKSGSCASALFGHKRKRQIATIIDAFT